MPQPQEKRQAKEALKALRKTIDQTFTPEQIEMLRRQLEEAEDRFHRLQEVQLENDDEPAPGFRPHRESGGTD